MWSTLFVYAYMNRVRQGLSAFAIAELRKVALQPESLSCVRSLHPGEQSNSLRKPDYHVLCSQHPGSASSQPPAQQQFVRFPILLGPNGQSYIPSCPLQTCVGEGFPCPLQSAVSADICVRPNVSRGYSTTTHLNGVDADGSIHNAEENQQEASEASATMDDGGENVGEDDDGTDPTPEQLEAFMLKLREDVENVLRVGTMLLHYKEQVICVGRRRQALPLDCRGHLEQAIASHHKPFENTCHAVSSQFLQILIVLFVLDQINLQRLVLF